MADNITEVAIAEADTGNKPPNKARKVSNLKRAAHIAAFGARVALGPGDDIAAATLPFANNLSQTPITSEHQPNPPDVLVPRLPENLVRATVNRKTQALGNRPPNRSYNGGHVEHEKVRQGKIARVRGFLNSLMKR